MEFNYAAEKKKFDQEHEQMYQEYIAAGMSEEDFLQIYEWDWELFKKERIYAMHNQAYPLKDFRDDEDYEDDCKNPLTYKFGDAFMADDRYCINDFIEWEGPIDQKQMQMVVGRLTKQQKEIMKLYCIDGLTHDEIAEKLGSSRKSVTSQMLNIRKKFHKFFKNV